MKSDIKIKPWIQFISLENSTEIVVTQCEGAAFWQYVMQINIIPHTKWHERGKVENENDKGSCQICYSRLMYKKLHKQL